MLRKTLLANGRGIAGYKTQQWQDKLFVGINSSNSDQINGPLAAGSMDSTCGSLLPSHFPTLGLARLMEPVSWGCVVSVTSLWRHMAKWLLHLSQAYTLSYSWLHPRHILGLFYPRMRFKAKSRLCLLGDMVLCSLLALCLDPCFQLFYTVHS